ncbi:MAG: hypothetical protein KatS3mg065_1206 [Chloroflexota bacterium]|nr:MAG: hypothetical protein KatS3mg065_1206 [Chloroflexota bacterium]
MTCSKTVTVSADRTNTATARGFSAQGTEVVDTDTAVVVIRHPDTGIDKSHDDADGVVGPGQVVTYTIVVQVVEGPVTNAVVTDELPDGQTYVSDSQQSSPLPRASRSRPTAGLSPGPSPACRRATRRRRSATR